MYFASVLFTGSLLPLRPGFEPPREKDAAQTNESRDWFGLNRPGFRRHLAAINYGLGGGGYEYETLHG